MAGKAEKERQKGLRNRFRHSSCSIVWNWISVNVSKGEVGKTKPRILCVTSKLERHPVNQEVPSSIHYTMASWVFQDLSWTGSGVDEPKTGTPFLLQKKFFIFLQNMTKKKREKSYNDGLISVNLIISSFILLQVMKLVGSREWISRYMFKL